MAGDNPPGKSFYCGFGSAGKPVTKYCIQATPTVARNKIIMINIEEGFNPMYNLLSSGK